MGLRAYLKPNEEMMINGVLVKNLEKIKIRVELNNHARLLLSRDMIPASAATTPATRVYFEAMLLCGGAPQGSVPKLHGSLEDVLALDPPESILLICDEMQRLSAEGEFFHCLMVARELVAAEDPRHPVLAGRASDEGRD